MKLVRRLYDWVLSWAHTRYATLALFILAFIESSFFPIPPDILLIALAVSIPAKSFRYALVCSIGSVLGGIFGYLIGMFLMEAVGNSIVAAYGLTSQFEYVRDVYVRYDAWAVAIAGFTPIPYKLFTISAGAFGINFPVFVLMSVVSRAARFFIVAALIYKFGAPVKTFIEKYFNILTIAFTVLLIGGFVLVKYVFG
ncbi:MAG: DedA family protein [Deltaproteobacteria bacterium]|nr:DedA family protein [Deltaproteobacteria bacterium]